MPCPCAGGDNRSAMVTVRPCARRGIIRPLPLHFHGSECSSPCNHTPHKEVLHPFQATKATGAKHNNKRVSDGGGGEIKSEGDGKKAQPESRRFVV